MSTNPAPCVYISVLNWNSASKTIQCLESLESLDYPHFHIVVVDNASIDDSVALIRAAFPQVEMICSRENLGYAGGNELALQRTLEDHQADLFWILNNDAITTPDTLAALVNAHRNFGDWALYGSVSILPQNHPDPWRVEMQLSDVRQGKVIPQNIRKISGKRYDLIFPTTEPRITGLLTGASLMIPLAVVRKYGFMETDFFLYSEETEYVFRLRASGVPSILVPASVITHAQSSSHRQFRVLKPLILYYQTRNRLIVWRRYASTIAYVGMLLKYLWYAAQWLIAAPIRGRSAIRCVEFTLLGIWHALRNRTGKLLAPEDWLKQ